MRRTLQKVCLALVLAVLASPALAGGLDLSLHYGFDSYDSVGLKSGLGGVGEEGRLRDRSTHLGATAIYRGGLAEIGVIGEIGRVGQDGGTTLLGLLGGLGVDMGPVRLEALGELGAHRYGDLLQDSAVLTRSHSEAWLVSLGLRPGLSLRLGEEGRIILGLWAFARWDLTSQDVQVNLGSAGISTYELGGAQFGAAARLGFSL
jgi:hypothetical protein